MFLASQQTPPTNSYTHICSRNLAQVPEISLWDSYYFDILLDRYYYFFHFTHEKTEVLVVQSDCSTPGFPVLHHLPELAQTHVHGASDAIQSFHPLSSPSPAFSLSQHQGLFQWVGSSHQMAKVLELQPSVPPMNIQDWFPLGSTGLISLPSKGLSWVFSNITVQKHQFFGTQKLMYFK